MASPLSWRKSRGRFIVCGSDSLALRLIGELQSLGEEVTVIVDNSSDGAVASIKSEVSTIVEGSARDVDVLRKAGIGRAEAIALLDPDDVDNLHAALAVREVNPSIRLVIRTFHAGLGARIGTLFDNCAVLSPGHIAAPSFVDAALGDADTRLVTVADQLLHIGPPEALQEVYLPLASLEPDGKPHPLPLDGADIRLALGRAPIRPATATKPRPVAGALAWRGFVSTMQSLFFTLASLRVRIAILLLAALAFVSGAIFHAGLGGNWTDAFYRTLTVVTATSYEELLANPVPAWVKVFGAAVLLTGMLLLAVVTALIVDDLIAARTDQRAGFSVGSPRHHVVVCGMGAVGLRVAEKLVAEGIPVVAIELNPDKAMLSTARRLGIPVIDGDASEEAILRAASTTTARCVMALTSNDVTNLQVGIASREIRPDVRVVLRLFDSELARRVEARLGLAISLSVSMAAAPVFAAAMLGREVLTVISYRRRVLLLADVGIEAGSTIEGAPLQLLEAPHEARIVAHVQGPSTVWHPDRATAAQAGHRVIVATTRVGLARVMRMASAGMGNHSSTNV